MSVNRKLAPLEKMFEMFNRLNNGSGNILVISHIRGYISENSLRKAINLTQQQHPNLNSRIVDSSESLLFKSKGTRSIPLRVMENCHDRQWEELALAEINQKIESSEVLARVLLLRNQKENINNYLLTTIHHSIADGLSSFKLQSQILNYYQRIESQQVITQATCRSQIPPLKELIPESVRKSLEEKKSSGNSQQSKNLHIETLDFEQNVPIELRSCGIIHRQLNKESTQRLLNACRKEKTTIHSALCAAMLLTAVKKIIVKDKKEALVSCFSAINLRKFLHPEIGDEHLGLITSMLLTFHQTGRDRVFWDLAREVKQQIQKGIDLGNIFSQKSETNKDIQMDNPNPLAATVAVSNLGRVNISKNYGSLELEEIHFVTGTASFDGVPFCTANTFNGTMFLNFPFSQPSLSPETMTIFVDRVLSLLNSCFDRS